VLHLRWLAQELGLKEGHQRVLDQCHQELRLGNFQRGQMQLQQGRLQVEQYQMDRSQRQELEQ